MKFRSLGKTGMKVSEIGFGGWAIGGGWGPQEDAESLSALHAAIDNGVTFIDTAAGYGNGRSERLIGQVLKERKEQVFVATKTPPKPGYWPPSPYCKAEERYPEDYLRKSVEERLTNLGVERLDLLQLHTWTRAWNRDAVPFHVLARLKKEGKIRAVGVSTPEQDQNAVIDLMRQGLVDTVQVIYNIFEQEPAAELLPVALEKGVGVIVRVALEEGAFGGKLTPQTRFDPGDFRSRYFAGDRLERTLKRVAEVEKDIKGKGYTLPQAALKFVLAHAAVSSVIPGIRSVAQARANTAVSDLPPMPEELQMTLHRHNWLRGFWYEGK